MDGTSAAFARAWDASMIAPECDEGVCTRGTYVASEFTAEAGGECVLHISAQGLYRAFINGKRVGEDYLTPGWTSYQDRIAYQTYDVSDLVSEGQNRIEIWLGDGWYRAPIMWPSANMINTWGDRVGAIAEIEQGGKIIAKTGPEWTGGLTPITQSGIYYGEDVDARLGVEPKGGVEVLDFDHGLLVPHETGAVVALETLSPCEAWTDAEGRSVYDFGQNVGGIVRVTMRGAAGAKVRVEHSEVLGPDKFFDNRNYRAARAAAEYTLSDAGDEVFEPLFSFMGFRYAQLEVIGDAQIVDVTCIPITSVPEVAGGFECAEPLVNRLVLNTIWSQRGNFIEVPTDCPQRDERLGWSGDAQVFAGTACWLADSESFLRKYLRDLMADQRPNGAIAHFSPDPTFVKGGTLFGGDSAGSTGWGDAIIVIPWQLYLHYGDDQVMRECWPAMLKWLDYLWNLSDGPIIQAGNNGINNPGSIFTFGDWLQPVGDNRKPRATISDDCAATLYHFIANDLAAKVGRVIGEEAAAADCAKRAEDIRAAFRHEYFSASGRLAHNDQTSYALAFLYDLVPDEYYEAAKGYFRRIVEDGGYLIGTGFIGTPALLPALTKLGLNDVAEKVFLNRDVPGWLYQVEQGATTIWERWDAMGPDGTIYEPSMNSFNHYAYGAVCQWLFEAVAGVAPTPEAPGYDQVVLDPQILTALGPVSMWHECRHGRIEAKWSVDGARVTYEVSLPEGCTATLAPSPARSGVTVNGTAQDVPESGVALGSGQHTITFDLTS